MRSLLSLAPFVFSTELARGDGAAVAMKRYTIYSCRGKKNNAKLFLLLFYSEAIIPEKNWLKVAPSLILEHLAVTDFPS